MLHFSSSMLLFFLISQSNHHSIKRKIEACSSSHLSLFFWYFFPSKRIGIDFRLWSIFNMRTKQIERMNSVEPSKQYFLPIVVISISLFMFFCSPSTFYAPHISHIHSLILMLRTHICSSSLFQYKVQNKIDHVTYRHIFAKRG